MPKIQRISGRGVPIPGHDIDTDRIIPARFLKTITFEGLGEGLFYDERFDAEGNPKPHPLNDPRFRGARIMVVGPGFGSGSSREHAPQAIKRAGFDAIIGVSFAEIFFGNATQIGLVCVRAESDQVARLMEAIERTPETLIEIDLAQMTVGYAGEGFPIQLPPAVREAFLRGKYDPLEVLLEAEAAIEAMDKARPKPGGQNVY